MNSEAFNSEISFEHQETIFPLELLFTKYLTSSLNGEVRIRNL